MKFTLLTNLSESSDYVGNQRGAVVLGAGEIVSVGEKSWNDSRDFVFIDVPESTTAYRVHKSILKPI